MPTNKNSIPGYEHWAAEKRQEVENLQQSRAVDQTAALNAAAQYALTHINNVLYERHAHLESEINMLRQQNVQLVDLVTQLNRNFLQFQAHIQNRDNGNFANVDPQDNNQPIELTPNNDGDSRGFGGADGYDNGAEEDDEK